MRAHLAGGDDELATVRPLLDRLGDFAELLRTDGGEAAFKALRAAETTGRPLGNASFIADFERLLGRKLARGRPEGQGDLWG